MKVLLTLVLIMIAMPSVLNAALDEIPRLAVEMSEDQLLKDKNLLFRKTLAIRDFENHSPALARYNAGAAVAASLASAMSHSTIFRLVERERMEEVMDEIRLGMTGAVDRDSAVEAGRLTGAERLIIGSVSETGDTVLVSVRLIDTATGEIISSRQVTIPREDVIAESREQYWSSFRSDYGIGIHVNQAVLFAWGGRNPCQISSLDISYRLLTCLRLSAGAFFLNAREYYRESYTYNYNATNYSIYRNYTATIAGPRFCIDGIYPLYRWLNVMLRIEFMPGVYGRMEQDVADFPVWISTGANANTLTTRRILVNSWTEDDGRTALFNFMLRSEFLISKRVSFHVAAGYLVATDFIPSVYQAGGVRNWSGDIDTNGTFPEYNDYNFARRGVNGKRVRMDLSGFTLSIGAAVHF